MYQTLLHRAETIFNLRLLHTTQPSKMHVCICILILYRGDTSSGKYRQQCIFIYSIAIRTCISHVTEVQDDTEDRCAKPFRADSGRFANSEIACMNLCIYIYTPTQIETEMEWEAQNSGIAVGYRYSVLQNHLRYLNEQGEEDRHRMSMQKH